MSTPALQSPAVMAVGGCSASGRSGSGMSGWRRWLMRSVEGPGSGKRTDDAPMAAHHRSDPARAEGGRTGKGGRFSDVTLIRRRSRLVADGAAPGDAAFAPHGANPRSMPGPSDTFAGGARPPRGARRRVVPQRSSVFRSRRSALSASHGKGPPMSVLPLPVSHEAPSALEGSERLPAVYVLDRDDDLGRLLDPSRMAMARRRLRAPLISLTPGPWVPPSAMAGTSVLALDGLLVREVVVADEVAAEIVGPGDVVPVLGDEPRMLPASVRWSAIAPAQLAVLGSRFARTLLAF